MTRIIHVFLQKTCKYITQANRNRILIPWGKHCKNIGVYMGKE